MKTHNGFEVVKVKEEMNNKSGANQIVWNVHPAIEYEGGSTNFVQTSAVVVMFTGEAETYIFACDKDGEWLSSSELPGSFKGGLDHEQAIMRLDHSRDYN